MYLFEETMPTFLARAAALGMRPREYIDRKLLTVQQVDPVTLTPSEFVHGVRDAVERDNARVVVIDSVNGYLAAMPDERALALNLRELIRYLSQRGVVILLVVAEHGLAGGLKAPVDISYLADTVIVLRYFEAMGEVRRALSVVKRRTGRHEHTIHELWIGPGITVGRALTDFEGVLAGIVNRIPRPPDGTDGR